VVSKPRFERMYTEVSAGFRGIWSRPEGFETTSNRAPGFVPNGVRLRIAILRNLRPHAIQEWI
jgi:hypothetical protein